jgi:hypothetical protein
MEHPGTLVRPDGTAISGRDLERGMRLSIAASMMSAVWSVPAYGMPIVMFMECLGASAVLIGLLGTVGQIALLVQIPAALVVDRLPARKAFWATTARGHDPRAAPLDSLDILLGIYFVSRWNVPGRNGGAQPGNEDDA